MMTKIGVEQRDSIGDIQIKELRSRIDEGLASLDRSEGVDGETLMQEMLDTLDSQEAQRKAG